MMSQDFAALDVGRATDAWVIDIKGVRKIDNEKIASLERYYEKKKNISEVIKETKKH
jgi:hypothetical protein